MDYGSMVSGAGEILSSSPFSNLSALAPPFKVDRLNPKPNSNPILQYSESPYGSEPFSHTWQYAIPSAPSPELDTNSVPSGTTSMPVANHYQFSASMSIIPSSTYLSSACSAGKTSETAFCYIGGVEPYYSPYIPTTVGQDLPLVEDNGPYYDTEPASGLDVSSQNDYIQSLYGLEYGPRWVGSLGFDNGMQAKGIEFDGSFSSEKARCGASYSCNNQVNRGGIIEYASNSKEDIGVSHEKLIQVSDIELHTGFTTVGRMEDKSYLEEKPSFLPYESNKIHTSASGSSYCAESPSCGLSSEKRKSNFLNTYDTHEKCAGSLDSPFTGQVSAMRSSRAVVIQPPPDVDGVLGLGGISRKSALVGDLDRFNPSKRKVHGQKSNSETLDGSNDAILFNLSKEGKGQAFTSSSSVKELSLPLDTNDTFGSQYPGVNGSSGFGSVQVVPSAEESSDFTDNHNLAVDSPCWKGAHSSQISSVDLDDCSSSHIKQNLDQNFGFDHEMSEYLQSAIDSMRTSSNRAAEANKNFENESSRDDVVLALERTLNAIYLTREENPSDGAKPVNRVSDDVPNAPIRESVLPKHFVGEEDTGSSLYDCGDIAVHAAEKVLVSLSSQEDAHSEWMPGLDVPTMIKAMHNLSDLLLCHLSNDASCTLEEKNSEILRDIISNLDSCKQIIQATNASEPKDPSGATKKLRGAHNVDTISGMPHMTNKAPGPHIQFGYRRLPGKSNVSFSGKKDEKRPVFSSLRDELDTSLDDDMTKAIKKVLGDNFNINEEMHSQSLLFKSLWLEVEAKLCSLIYRARFDRMKVEMEKAKPKLPREYEDVVLSKVSPDPIMAPTHDVHRSRVLKTSLKDSSISSNSTIGGDDIEDSVMARLNILKSREDSLNPNMALIHKVPDSKLPKSFLQSSSFSNQCAGHADDDTEDSVMARLNILKSREEQHPVVIDVHSVSSVMARFNTLRSREEKLKSINAVENRPEVGDADFADMKYVEPSNGDQSENKILNVALRPHFVHQTGISSEGKYGSSVGDGFGFESLKALNLSSINDPITHLDESRMILQHYLGRRDSSSVSDWEHVQEDVLGWKNV